MKAFAQIAALSTIVLGGIDAFVPSPRTIATPRILPLHMSVPNMVDTATSGLASIFRLPGGTTIMDESKELPAKQRPKLLQLYDVENSPACRKVRERITELDLSVNVVIPSAPNSRVFTDEDYKYYLPPGTEIPRLILIEPGTGEIMLSGADEIIGYLEEKFGVLTSDERNSQEHVLMFLRDIGNYASTLCRMGRGMKVSPAAKNAPTPNLPLILYSYEGNQFCRLVREVLTELDIVYELRSSGKKSPRRNELAKRTGGSTKCPYLIDPNTGEEMDESVDIIKYLYKKYAMWTPPSESLEWTSDFILPLFRPLFSVLAPIQAGSNQENKSYYDVAVAKARAEIEEECEKHPVVVYSYSLSPFSSECKKLLENLDIEYKEISLGAEWIPGLITEGGAAKRVAFKEMSGQTSLPQIFVGGKPIGGLFSGTPGLVPALERGILKDMVTDAMRKSISKGSIETSAIFWEEAFGSREEGVSVFE